MAISKKKSPRSSAGALDAKTFFAQKSARGDARVDVDGIEVSLTKLNKVFWPEEGYTKFDLLKYYYSMWKTLAPYLKDRPLILKRYPNGIEGMMFYQHNIEDTPDFVDSFTRTDSEGKPVRYAIANNLATLLYLTNLGTITINPWFSRRQSTEKPDYFAFDLDPGDTATFEQVKTVALEVKRVLEEVGLKGYPKTSGSSGIHIYVPVKPDYTYDHIVPFAKKLATMVADRHPKDATVRRMTRDRAKHEVYVDYLQNIEGKTLAAAYSVREKPKAMVSAPLEWKEINKKLQLDQFTIATIPARLKKKGDLFADVLKKKQSLVSAMKKVR
jgi:bifunctional non-homologous end joining protein LigD